MTLGVGVRKNRLRVAADDPRAVLTCDVETARSTKSGCNQFLSGKRLGRGVRRLVVYADDEYNALRWRVRLRVQVSARGRVKLLTTQTKLTELYLDPAGPIYQPGQHAASPKATP